MKVGLILLLACAMVKAGPFYDCPMRDMSFNGAPFMANFIDTGSWQECGQICDSWRYPDVCDYWTLTSGGNCFLFDTSRGIMEDGGSISGENNCH